MCGHTDRQPVAGQRVLDLNYGDQDEALAEHSLSYVACDLCGTVSQEPMPTSEDLENYYASMVMERHVPAAALYKGIVYQDRLELLRRVTGLVDGTCLEVGCGNGVFLEMVIAKWGLQPWGVEPSEAYDTDIDESVPIVRKPLEAVDPALDDLPASFDLVICRHVLEHIHQPAFFLDRLVDLVGHGGWLYLEVPSSVLHARPEEPVSGQNIHPLHLHHYTGPGLTAAITQRGLHVSHLEDRAVGGYPSLCLATYRPHRDGARLFQEQLNRQEYRYRHAAERLTHAQHFGDPDHGPVLIWGAGADLFAVLPHVDVEERSKLLLYDRNPRKQGKTLSGVAIMTTAELDEMKPRLIVAGCSNRSLVEDIRADTVARFPGVPTVGLFDKE